MRAARHTLIFGGRYDERLASPTGVIGDQIGRKHSMISMASGLYVALMRLVVGRAGDLWLPGAFLLMGGVVLVGSLVFGGSRTSQAQ